MVSNALSLRADYSPGGPLSGGVTFKGENDNFFYPSTPGLPGSINLINQVTGIKQDYNLTAGLDVNYRLAESVDLHGYYTYEQIYFNNLGNGACADSNTDGCTGSAGYFQNKQTTDVNTVGISGEWKATDKLKVTGQYSLSYGAVMFGQYNGVFVPPTSVTQTYQNVVNYPDNKSVLNIFSLKFTYQINPNMELSLAGAYSLFNSRDFDDTTPSVVPNCLPTGGCTAAQKSSVAILTPGYVSPTYNVGMVVAALKIKW